eukprot:TRINITY_DN1603_c0_g2_i4.p1 TRINITY_DN1603_c0_g2~~TRINITY_DN1603_c0_g2_i4.p1  ORF type:complete len:1309 (+),score=451.08 TRINITY_DN1603_c0_g2_i4:63-3989(+)
MEKVFVPRGYQIELFQRARDNNAIAYLDTGAGKTFISVLLLDHVSPSLMKRDGTRKWAFFMGCTVPLVQQQADALRKQLPNLKVALIVGDMNVDGWSEAAWRQKFEETDLFILTPQILVNLIMHGFFKLSDSALLIFDECHHTIKNHPYNQLMSSYFRVPSHLRPKIFGMTASPLLTLKVDDTLYACQMKFQQLESRLDSTVFTVSDRSELKEYISTPLEEILLYDPTIPDYIPPHVSYMMDQRKVIGRICSDYGRIFQDAIDILCDLGPCGCYLFLAIIAKNFLKSKLHPRMSAPARNDIEISMQIVESSAENIRPSANVAKGYIGKAHRLITQLHQNLANFEDPSFRAILFIQTKLEVEVVRFILKYFPAFKLKIRVNFLVGHQENFYGTGMDMKSQNKVVQKFKDGKINLLIATSVGQEGIDIQPCRLVMHLSPINNVKDYVQSRGRARHKDSILRLFVPMGDYAQVEFLGKIQQAERMMREAVYLREDHQRFETDDDGDFYEISSTGARIDLHQSVSLVYQYCGKLPGDRFTDHFPKEEIFYAEGGYQCRVRMPLMSPVKMSEGLVKSKKKLARASAHLEMVKQLHKGGHLTDFLTCDFQLEDLQLELESDQVEISENYVPEIPQVLCRPLQIDLNQDDVQVEISRWTICTFETDRIWSLGIVLPNWIDPADLPSMENLTVSVFHKEYPRFHLENIAKFHRNLFSIIKPGLYNNSKISTRKSYLFVPLIGSDIDWDVILQVETNLKSIPAVDLLQLENFNIETLFPGKVVTRKNVGGHFQVEKIDFDSTADSKFEKTAGFRPTINLEKEKHRTYVEFYADRGIHLNFPEFPLLQVRRISFRKFQDEVQVENIPFELCTVVNIPGKFLEGSVLLFRHLFNWERRLLTIQFEKDMKFEEFNLKIPMGMLQSCLTSRNVEPVANYERLETLGDAFLKWKVSVWAFSEFSQGHEGQLSILRAKMISNSNLRKIGILKKIHRYISMNPFKLEDMSVATLRENSEISIPQKIVADVVEALIGAFHLCESGDPFLKWMNIPCEMKSIPQPIQDPNFDYSTFQEIQDVLQYQFKNPEILRQALTHSSSMNTSCKDSYQRLEFLGDAALGYLITGMIYKKHQETDPGKITDLLIFLVNNDMFAQLTIRYGFHRHIHLESEDLAVAIQKYVDGIPSTWDLDAMIARSSFGSDAPKTLGDIWESIAGAILIDSDMDLNKLKTIYLDHLMKDVISIGPNQVPIHPVRELQEWCQKKSHRCEFRFDTTRCRTNLENGDTKVHVVIDGEEIASASGSNKRSAKFLAARTATKKLNTNL